VSGRAWQAWAAAAGFAFLLHFAWEMLQFPLYTGMAEAPHGPATWTCLQATLGDVALSLAALGATAIAARGNLWRGPLRPGHLALYIASGLALSLALEYASVHLWRRWQYGPGTPAFLGIGLPPLLQWTLLPPLVLWLVRRHVAAGEPKPSIERETHA
jgi:hypothetical protein